MIREEVRKVSSGYLMLVVLAVAQLGFAYAIFRAGVAQNIPGVIGFALASVAVAICWAGLFMVHPNEAKVMQLFGKYVGTAHDPGLKWANPFYAKTAVSTRVRNFESSKLKVNDSRGSPIEIAAVVVWKVFDTAEALFEVDDYEEFDRLTWSGGEELVPVSAARWRLENESEFLRITRLDSGWEVVRRDGVKLMLGTEPLAQTASDGKVFR